MPRPFILKRFATLAFCLATSCLVEADPGAGGPLLYYSLYGLSGACLVEVEHSTLSSTKLRFCTAVPRHRCSSDGFALNQAEKLRLRTDIASVGLEIGACAADALAQVTILDDASSPVAPHLLQYNVTRAAHIAPAANYIGLAGCEDLNDGTLLAQPGELLAASEIDTLLVAQPYLYLYAVEPTCRQAIPLTPLERQLIAEVEAQRRSILKVCDSGAGNDLAVADCSAGR